MPMLYINGRRAAAARILPFLERQVPPTARSGDAGYQQPMQGDLLWVYEGLSNYYGEVLAARSGMLTPELFRGYVAWLASYLSHIPGRSWRSLQDTANNLRCCTCCPATGRAGGAAPTSTKKGDMLWLDVDTKIRELSHDTRSLDDFARAFHGIRNGDVGVVGYQFADVVAALQAVQPYDWAQLLHSHLDATDPGPLLDGLARSGWQLDYTDHPDRYFTAYEADTKVVDLIASLGILVDDPGEDPAEGDAPGKLLDVLWNGPAFSAGVAPGMGHRGGQWHPVQRRRAEGSGPGLANLPAAAAAAAGE